MNVEKLIELLNTMPKDATVALLNSEEGYAILDRVSVVRAEATSDGEYRIDFDADVTAGDVVVGIAIGCTF